MTKEKKLTAHQTIQRSYLVTVASNILNMNPTDISKIFKISRETVYGILRKEDLSKLNIK